MVYGEWYIEKSGSDILFQYSHTWGGKIYDKDGNFYYASNLSIVNNQNPYPAFSIVDSLKFYKAVESDLIKFGIKKRKLMFHYE